MKKYIVSSIFIFLIVFGIFTIILLNSDYYYAKKLVKAIEKEDLVAIEQILEKKPSCVNTYPQILPERMFYRMAEDYGPSYPLTEACRSDNVEIVKILVEAGADVNCNDRLTPLSYTYMCKRNNWYEISLYLIEHGASLDYVTVYYGSKSAVLMDIVQTGSGPAFPGDEPEREEEVLAAFYYAIDHCDHSQVDWMNVLQDSVSDDRVEIVQYLLDEGYCDVNDTSRDMSALMFAARDSTSEMVQLLLDRGADKSYVDSRGMTAYDYAAKEQKAEIMELLED